MKIKLIIGTIITMALLIGGIYFIAQDDNAFYCESRDMIMLCEKLSSGLGTRCYYSETYKICKEGWKKFENQELKPESYDKKYLCDQIECKIINNKVTSELNKQVKMEV